VADSRTLNLKIMATGDTALIKRIEALVSSEKIIKLNLPSDAALQKLEKLQNNILNIKTSLTINSPVFDTLLRWEKSGLNIKVNLTGLGNLYTNNPGASSSRQSSSQDAYQRALLAEQTRAELERIKLGEKSNPDAGLMGTLTTQSAELSVAGVRAITALRKFSRTIESSTDKFSIIDDRIKDLNETLSGTSRFDRVFGRLLGRSGADVDKDIIRKASLNAGIPTSRQGDVKLNDFSLLDFSVFKDRRAINELAFGGLFGGAGGLAGGLVGGATFGNVLLGSTIGSVVTEGIIKNFEKLAEALRSAAESGLEFERSITSLAAVFQSTSRATLNGKELNPIDSQRFFQGRSANLLKSAQARLVPLGIGSQSVGTAASALGESLSQTGADFTDEQFLNVLIPVLSAIATINPGILENPTQLRRDILDRTIGRNTAFKAAIGGLAPGFFRPTGSIDDILSGISGLNVFPEALRNSPLPAQQLNRISGFASNIETQSATTFLEQAAPGFKAIADALTDPKLQDSIVELAKDFGEITDKILEMVSNALPGFITALDNTIKEVIKLINLLRKHPIETESALGGVGVVGGGIAGAGGGALIGGILGGLGGLLFGQPILGAQAGALLGGFAGGVGGGILGGKAGIGIGKAISAEPPTPVKQEEVVQESKLNQRLDNLLKPIDLSVEGITRAADSFIAELPELRNSILSQVEELLTEDAALRKKIGIQIYEDEEKNIRKLGEEIAKTFSQISLFGQLGASKQRLQTGVDASASIQRQIDLAQEAYNTSIPGSPEAIQKLAALKNAQRKGQQQAAINQDNLSEVQDKQNNIALAGVNAKKAILEFTDNLKLVPLKLRDFADKVDAAKRSLQDFDRSSKLRALGRQGELISAAEEVYKVNPNAGLPGFIDNTLVRGSANFNEEARARFDEDLLREKFSVLEQQNENAPKVEQEQRNALVLNLEETNTALKELPLKLLSEQLGQLIEIAKQKFTLPGTEAAKTGQKAQDYINSQFGLPNVTLPEASYNSSSLRAEDYFYSLDRYGSNPFDLETYGPNKPKPKPPTERPDQSPLFFMPKPLDKTELTNGEINWTENDGPPPERPDQSSLFFKPKPKPSVMYDGKPTWKGVPPPPIDVLDPNMQLNSFLGEPIDVNLQKGKGGQAVNDIFGALLDSNARGRNADQVQFLLDSQKTDLGNSFNQGIGIPGVGLPLSFLGAAETKAPRYNFRVPLPTNPDFKIPYANEIGNSLINSPKQSTNPADVLKDIKTMMQTGIKVDSQSIAMAMNQVFAGAN